MDFKRIYVTVIMAEDSYIRIWVTKARQAATRQKGETTNHPVVKEVLVMQKRLLVIEEIRLIRQQT